MKATRIDRRPATQRPLLTQAPFARSQRHGQSNWPSAATPLRELPPMRSATHASPERKPRRLSAPQPARKRRRPKKSAAADIRNGDRRPRRRTNGQRRAAMTCSTTLRADQPGGRSERRGRASRPSCTRDPAPASSSRSSRSSRSSLEPCGGVLQLTHIRDLDWPERSSPTSPRHSMRQCQPSSCRITETQHTEGTTSTAVFRHARTAQITQHTSAASRRLPRPCTDCPDGPRPPGSFTTPRPPS